jgi:hypothetical protein
MLKYQRLRNPLDKHEFIRWQFMGLLGDAIVHKDSKILAEAINMQIQGYRCLDCDNIYNECNCEKCEDCKQVRCICDISEKEITRIAWELAEKTLTPQELDDLNELVDRLWHQKNRKKNPPRNNVPKIKKPQSRKNPITPTKKNIGKWAFTNFPKIASENVYEYYAKLQQLDALVLSFRENFGLPVEKIQQIEILLKPYLNAWRHINSQRISLSEKIKLWKDLMLDNPSRFELFYT